MSIWNSLLVFQHHSQRATNSTYTVDHLHVILHGYNKVKNPQRMFSYSEVGHLSEIYISVNIFWFILPIIWGTGFRFFMSNEPWSTKWKQSIDIFSFTYYNFTGINFQCLRWVSPWVSPYFSAPPVYFMTVIRPQCMTCIL